MKQVCLFDNKRFKELLRKYSMKPPEHIQQ